MNFNGVSDLVSIDENHFLVLKKGLLFIVFADDNKFIWTVIQEKYYKGKLLMII
jgi:hypothetical protein